MKQPWMKFYPSDWQADLRLRSCSAAARGLWVELLCIMQQAQPKGYLLVNGQVPARALLAVLCGIPEREVGKLTDELRAAGVFSETDDGVIYSRRIIRDEERVEKDKANGRKGGNPTLKAGVNPPDNPNDNPPVNGGDKAHIPDARSQSKRLSQEGDTGGEVDHSRGLRLIGDAA